METAAGSAGPSGLAQVEIYQAPAVRAALRGMDFSQ